MFLLIVVLLDLIIVNVNLLSAVRAVFITRKVEIPKEASPASILS